MGRSVESGSDSLLDIRMYWEEDHTSFCRFCGEEVQQSYGPHEWVPAETKFGKEYTPCPDNEDGEHIGWEYDSDNWQNDLEYYQDWLIELLPSLVQEDSFNTSNSYLRESRVIARNGLVEVRVSEYSGTTNLSFAPTEDAPVALAKHWIEHIAPKVEALRG